MNPSQVGAIAGFAVANALNRAGLVVFTPFFGGHSRVDLVYLNDVGVARRVQCKTARLADGYVSFYTCSNTGGVRRTYRDEVDEFGVYCVGNERVYIVPIEDVPTRAARLRVEPTRSNQSRGIRWAEPYLGGPPW